MKSCDHNLCTDGRFGAAARCVSDLAVEQRKPTLCLMVIRYGIIDLRWQLCFQWQTFGRTPASHQLSPVPTCNSHSRGDCNNASYLSDTVVLSFSTMYLTDDDSLLQKD